MGARLSPGHPCHCAASVLQGAIAPHCCGWAAKSGMWKTPGLVLSSKSIAVFAGVSGTAPASVSRAVPAGRLREEPGAQHTLWRWWRRSSRGHLPQPPPLHVRLSSPLPCCCVEGRLDMTSGSNYSTVVRVAGPQPVACPSRGAVPQPVPLRPVPVVQSQVPE